MVPVLETFVAVVLNAALAALVWLRYHRVGTPRRPPALGLALLAAAGALSIAAAALIQGAALGLAALLLELALGGVALHLLLRQRVFETTREAIDQALASMAEGIAVLTAEGKVLFTNPAMAEHLHLVTDQALSVGRVDHSAPASGDAEEAHGAGGPGSTSRGDGGPPSSQLSGDRSTLERIEHELLRQSLGEARAEICLDRSDRSLVVSSSPVKDRYGRVQGHLLLARDVTVARTYERELQKRNEDLHRLLDDLQEGKRAEERAHREKAAAEAANIAKSTFLANMSHELRTPLNAILGFVQLMERDWSLAEQHRDNLAVIGRSGQHLLRLINDILEMSKIEAGRVSLTESSFDLYAILKSLEEMFSIQAERRGLKLVFERAPEVPRHVRADEGKLRQVLINLLGNAVKFTDRGRVRLRVARGATITDVGQAPHTERLRFSISDTGRGIAPADRERLFAPFAQAGGVAESAGGTGLGLSISREFVRLMGGEIEVESELGEGSTFTFEVDVTPASPGEIIGERRARSAIGLASGQPIYRVLVVDDQWENRNLLVKTLQVVGFDVRSAENGLDALDQWDAWEPHLVWMDMRMPVMDGYEATRRIKATQRGKSTVVIALTASAFEHDRAMVLSVGCDDFVRKPFRDGEVFDKMEAHLGVRFVYADRGDAGEARPSERPLGPEALRALPADLVEELRRASTALNTKAVQAVIERIREGDAPLADALEVLVRGYRFDTILELTERAGEKTT